MDLYYVSNCNFILKEVYTHKSRILNPPTNQIDPRETLIYPII